MIFKSKTMILLALLLLLAGCNDDLAGLADQKSLDRLASLPADSGLLLCLQADGALGKLPDLGPGGRQLGRFGPSTLVEVSRDAVPALAKIEGLKSMVLWGDENAAGKLDPMLKSELLGSMANPDWRLVQHRVIGTFDLESSNLKDALTAAGAQAGSVVDGIATFKASNEIIFDILAWENLRQLKKPTLMRPAQSLK